VTTLDHVEATEFTKRTKALGPPRFRSARDASNLTEAAMAKILCVLYPDPIAGQRTRFARDTIPTI
jgi:hypothetical protein